jgi:hypothetical protein
MKVLTAPAAAMTQGLRVAVTNVTPAAVDTLAVLSVRHCEHSQAHCCVVISVTPAHYADAILVVAYSYG